MYFSMQNSMEAFRWKRHAEWNILDVKRRDVFCRIIREEG